MSSERIDQLYLAARGAGVIGGKLVGAGGGGFLLVYSDDPERTRQAMRQLDADEVQFSIDISGCTGHLIS